MSSTDLRNSLNTLGDAIMNVATQPTPPQEPADRSISGNKINGGIITNFRSVGVKDVSTNVESPTLLVENEKITVRNINTETITNDLTVQGGLTVDGHITATSLHVDEITADVRHERTSPLEFTGGSKWAYGKGLIWSGGQYTAQLVLQGNPDRIFSTESIDVPAGKTYHIDGQPVITSDSLGTNIVNSNLTSVGTLENLRTEGSMVIDHFIYYEPSMNRLGLGTEAPNGMFAVMSFDHEFIIDETENRSIKLGTYSASDLEVITDNTTRLTVTTNGNVKIANHLTSGTLSVGVENPAQDVSITTAGAVRFQGKKQEVGTTQPAEGVYNKGDIVWNENPKPSGKVGWICIRGGTPGEWKAFGTIDG